MNSYICSNFDELKTIAKALIDKYPNERLFAFRGQMGAGKTTFIKEVCAYLGCIEPVTSPTFAIINEYQGTDSIVYHFDFYRLKNSTEAINIGFDEYIHSGEYCLMEWPEIIEDILPKEITEIIISVDEITNQRTFKF
ncbi:MAG: tRNA (adenosine(37)-N6)-threonylcarbamoyltransferase complex ATPase subunit type 1 TsaE [Bacteroidota bacterium]